LVQPEIEEILVRLDRLDEQVILGKLDQQEFGDILDNLDILALLELD
jgi:hypothetical protein